MHFLRLAFNINFLNIDHIEKSRFKKKTSVLGKWKKPRSQQGRKFYDSPGKIFRARLSVSNIVKKSRQLKNILRQHEPDKQIKRFTLCFSAITKKNRRLLYIRGKRTHSGFGFRKAQGVATHSFFNTEKNWVSRIELFFNILLLFSHCIFSFY